MHPVAGALDHQLLTHFVDEEKLVVLVDGLEFAVRGLPGLPLDPSAVYHPDDARGPAGVHVSVEVIPEEFESLVGPRVYAGVVTSSACVAGSVGLSWQPTMSTAGTRQPSRDPIDPAVRPHSTLSQ